MNKVNVLVLGGFGFIGRHLASKLLTCNYNVTLFGRFPENFDSEIIQHVKCVDADLSDFIKLKEAVFEADIIFHLLGSATPKMSLSDSQKDIKDNLLSTLVLLDYCTIANVKQLVFASSGGTVYGVPNNLPIKETHPTNPICAYGLNKLIVEHYMRLYSKLDSIDMTVIRLANPYGPFQNIKRGQGIISTYCEDIVMGRCLQVWGDGSVIRDYLYIDDVVNGLEKVIGAKGYNIFNLGSGIGTSINQLLKTFEDVIENKLNVTYLPARIVDVPSNILNVEKFCSDFSWRPKVSLDEGIRRTLVWHQNLDR